MAIEFCGRQATAISSFSCLLFFIFESILLQPLFKQKLRLKIKWNLLCAVSNHEFSIFLFFSVKRQLV